MKYLITLISFIFLLGCTKVGKNMTIKGRAVNPITGEGIPGARVFLSRSKLDIGSATKIVKETTTDENGSFEISKLSLSHCYLHCDPSVAGDYYQIGWEQKKDVPLFDAFTISVKKGKTMHADYYALQYGEIKISFHNINCGGSNDTFIFNRTYHSLPNVSVFQPMTFTGCVDNDGAFAKVPNGDYLIEWTVIKSGISNSYSHIMTVPPNGQASFNIDY